MTHFLNFNIQNNPKSFKMKMSVNSMQFLQINEFLIEFNNEKI